MTPTERHLHRLRYEMMDWCRNQPIGHTRQPAIHRETINGDPGVWDDD